MKWGLAWTKVLRRLSSLVWKSCVKVESGSNPFCKSMWAVGAIRNVRPLGTVSLLYNNLSSTPNKWLTKPKVHKDLWNIAITSSLNRSELDSRKALVSYITLPAKWRIPNTRFKWSLFSLVRLTSKYRLLVKCWALIFWTYASGVPLKEHSASNRLNKPVLYWSKLIKFS